MFAAFAVVTESKILAHAMLTEDVKGITLDDYFQKVSFVSKRDVWFKLLHEAASQLTILHSSGVVHADIKEQNIVIRRSDGKIFFIDFGNAISKDVYRSYFSDYLQNGNASALDDIRFLPTTITYASPEAYLVWKTLKKTEVTPFLNVNYLLETLERNDVYSLCATFRNLIARDQTLLNKEPTHILREYDRANPPVRTIDFRIVPTAASHFRSNQTVLDGISRIDLQKWASILYGKNTEGISSLDAVYVLTAGMQRTGSPYGNGAAFQQPISAFVDMLKHEMFPALATIRQFREHVSRSPSFTRSEREELLKRYELVLPHEKQV
jgi:serine/threonine protein kinase